MLELAPNELVQILLLLYGFSDTGDYWHENLMCHHLSHQRMWQSTGDSSLFFRGIANRLVIFSGTYVDDLLQAASPEERHAIQTHLQQTLDISIDEYQNIVFTEIECDLSILHLRHLSQKICIHRLQLLLTSTSWDDLRTLRAKLLQVIHTHPEICCAVSFPSQTT